MSYVRCQYCNGKGKVVRGGYGAERQCPLCDGKGECSQKGNAGDKHSIHGMERAGYVTLAVIAGALGLWFMVG